MEPIDKRPRVAEDAAEAIRRFIVDQQLSPGDMLPSERQIQQQLQISRASVREALRLLQMMGLVEARHGKGLFVSGSNLLPMVDAYVNTIRLVDEDSFGHLLDVREALELGAADLAAKLRTPDDLQRLEAVLTVAKHRVQTGGSALKEDLGFHDLLIKATHNPLLERLYSCIAPFLLEVRTRSAERAEREHVGSREDDWKVAIHDHTTIFHAIRDQDTALAVRLMHEHLDHVRKQIQFERSERRETEAKSREAVVEPAIAG
jgi:GntR family transcriptional regulator, transcriptional repressor for pyruvate dehydrogenase complex